MSTVRTRRSAAPWLFGLAFLLVVLGPLVFLGVLVADDLLTAVLATAADLTAAAIAAVVATVLVLRRGIATVRTAVTGHPQGRAARLAEEHATRRLQARDRFATLCTEWAAFEADRGAVGRRPALADVSVPATARFVDAYRDAEHLLDATERGEPRGGEFVAAVDRAERAWWEAQRVAAALAADDRA